MRNHVKCSKKEEDSPKRPQKEEERERRVGRRPRIRNQMSGTNIRRRWFQKAKDRRHIKSRDPHLYNTNRHEQNTETPEIEGNPTFEHQNERERRT